MTNEIRLKGIICNIQPSHTIGEIQYDKADLIVKRVDGREDVLDLRFKKFCNPYKDGQEICLKGNIRSFSKQVTEGHNKVEVYVFTYFDIPELNEEDKEDVNTFEVIGDICKIDTPHITKNGKRKTHFIVANNITTQSQSLNSYLPCISWGKYAKQIEKLSVGDTVKIGGQLHSREYTKTLSTGETEIRVAHELTVTSIEKIDNAV